MLSNTATPKYYAEFRRKVQSGELPVNYKILQQMDRIEKKIASPIYYFDPAPVEGYIRFCEHELVLTDGSPLQMTDTAKLPAEDKVIMVIGYAILILFCVAIVFPMIYIILASFIDPVTLQNQGLTVDFSKWTLTAFAELEDCTAEGLADPQVKVIRADSPEGLGAATPMANGVTVKEKKNAVKVELEVEAPVGASAQFFKVRFGE